MSRKNYTLVLVLALCTLAFACFLYLRSRPTRRVKNMRPAAASSPSRQSGLTYASTAPLTPVHLEETASSHLTFNWLGDETAYSGEEEVAPNQGFILVGTYGGQQGAGVESLVSLQCWMKSLHLNVPIVEPFVQNSVLGGLREEYDKIKFSDIFDLEMFNHVSRSEGVARIVPYSRYLHHASRDAIFVKMERIGKKLSHLPPPEVVWAATPGSDECYQLPANSSVVLPHYEDGHHYCYVRVVRAYHQILNKNTITSEQFYSTVLGGEELEGLTVILSLWRTPWHVSDCRTVTVRPPKIRDSPRLVQAVERYKQQFALPDGQYVAVMLRAEHAYLMIHSHIRNHKPTGYTLQQCLDEASTEAHAVLTEMNSSSVFVTADSGRYGTSSWLSSLHRPHHQGLLGITAQVEETVERLYDGRWSFQDWENSFSEATGGVEDRGYVAALQRVLASQAACLVLLGGGSFQKLALTSYLHHTKNQTHTHCVRLVCMDRVYGREYKQLVQTS